MAEIHDVPATTETPPDPAVGYARLTGLLGVAFAGLLAVGLVLVHRSPSLSASDADYTAFYGDGGRTVLVTVGLYLVPFAGIAFLWHMTTVRLLVRELTPVPACTRSPPRRCCCTPGCCRGGSRCSATSWPQRCSSARRSTRRSCSSSPAGWHWPA